jgi:hypothetical protein
MSTETETIQNLHVDVRKDRDGKGFYVEESFDGARFQLVYFCPPLDGETETANRARAEATARIYVHGLRVGSGRDLNVRATSGGYAL